MFRPLTSISVRGANLLRQCRCTQLQSFTRSAHLHPPSTSQTSSRAASSQAVPLHPPTLNLTNESPCSGSRSSDVHAYPSGDSVIVSWPDGKESRFDNFYLLDHCRCPRCFHPQTKQRLKSLFQFPSDIRPEGIEASSDSIRVIWNTSTPHESTFPISFLKRASYDPVLTISAADERILWNSKIVQSPPLIHYDSILPSAVGDEEAERGVLEWLDKVHDFGFCLVTGVPPHPKDTESLIQRIATIRQTHYGGFWDFTADMSHGDLAYSSEALPAHTDTTYFTDPAGLQIFHLLSHHGKGGTTLLLDAFYTANILSTLYPTSYSLLSRLRIPFHASGTPGSILRTVISQPILRHDDKGQLVQVRWNNEDRGVLGARWRPDEVRGWYQAARQFEELCRNSDAEYWVQLNPGTMLVIDNWRVMHGRSAFDGERRMCGAYIGADDWRSRRRALQQRFARKKPDETWDVGW